MSATVRLLSVAALGAAACLAFAACTDGTTPDCSDAGECNVIGPSSDASSADTGTPDTGASDAGASDAGPDASADAKADAPSDGGRPADAGGQ